MNKLTIILLFLHLPMLVVSQEQLRLHVKEGEIKKLSLSNISVNEFIMEDNSTIKLEGIDKWSLSATIGKIGKNCNIIGVGNDGGSGSPGNSGNPGGECQRGGNGSSGSSGSSGSNGITITLKMEIIDLGTLTINTSGGKGGDGGNGGSGGNGGQADISKDCRGGNGGDGGVGGNAGQGGCGGNIAIEFCNNGKHPQFNVASNINVINTIMNAGRNGNVGIGGDFGRGGPGKSKTISKIPKIEVNKGGGDNGSRGANGDSPEQAKSGILTNGSINCEDCLDNIKEETYAIIISVSKTDNKEGDNPVFSDEAKKLEDVLRKNYSFDSIFSYYNVSRRDLEEIFSTLGQTYGEGSKIFIYLNGHGLNYNGIPSFNTKDNFPMPFNLIYSYAENAIQPLEDKNPSVERILLVARPAIVT